MWESLDPLCCSSVARKASPKCFFHVTFPQPHSFKADILQNEKGIIAYSSLVSALACYTIYQGFWQGLMPERAGDGLAEGLRPCENVFGAGGVWCAGASSPAAEGQPGASCSLSSHSREGVLKEQFICSVSPSSEPIGATSVCRAHIGQDFLV